MTVLSDKGLHELAHHTPLYVFEESTTRNANVVINTDADQISVAEVSTHSGDGLPPMSYQSGGLDEAHLRKNACDILEGGKRAFKDQVKRLQIGLTR